MENYSAYSDFIRPDFAPPSWLFGPVWTFLYILIFISFGYAFFQIIKKQIPGKKGLPLLLNLFSNLAFTPLFGAGFYLLATLDILIILTTILWIMYSFWNTKRWISLLQVPYLLWVSFATVLQISILILN